MHNRYIEFKLSNDPRSREALLTALIADEAGRTPTIRLYTDDEHVGNLAVILVPPVEEESLSPKGESA